MKKTIFRIAVIFIVLCSVLSATAYADSPTDEIEDYTITVDMLPDGSMDMTYHFDWKVLSDAGVGPLTWVRIGIANTHVDALTPLSDNIGTITYNGNYVRIDFKGSYSAGDTLSFDFSLQQSHVYELDEQSDLCTYRFTPGWFDDIAVKSLTIRWNKADVRNSDAESADGEYLVWNTALGAGDRKTIYVEYAADVFQLDSGDSGSSNDAILIYVFAGIAILFIFIRARGGDNYRGGFGGRGRGIGYHSHMGCACASSCACACACACAGGGRAGCTAKNFYGSIKMEKLKEKLTDSSVEITERKRETDIDTGDK